MELDWSVNFHNTGLWVGYYTSDMVAVIDLGSLQRISSVEVSALTDLSAWIMGPQAISIFLSSNGKSYKRVSRQTYQAPTDAMGEKRSELNRFSFNKKSARYVKVLVEPFKGLPKGHSGEGEPPFLFVDEIRVDWFLLNEFKYEFCSHALTVCLYPFIHRSCSDGSNCGGKYEGKRLLSLCFSPVVYCFPNVICWSLVC